MPGPPTRQGENGYYGCMCGACDGRPHCHTGGDCPPCTPSTKGRRHCIHNGIGCNVDHAAIAAAVAIIPTQDARIAIAPDRAAAQRAKAAHDRMAASVARAELDREEREHYRRAAEQRAQARVDALKRGEPLPQPRPRPALDLEPPYAYPGYMGAGYMGASMYGGGSAAWAAAHPYTPPSARSTAPISELLRYLGG